MKFKAPEAAGAPEPDPFSVFATASTRTVVASVPWAREAIARAATAVNNQHVVGNATSYGESNLARAFPLTEEDEGVLRILEVDPQVTEFLRTTAGQPAFDPAKPFGAKPSPAVRAADKFARQTEGTASLMARLSAYL